MVASTPVSSRLSQEVGLARTFQVRYVARLYWVGLDLTRPACRLSYQSEGHCGSGFGGACSRPSL